MKRKLLWDELYQYGYVFSWKKSLGMYGVVVAFAPLLGRYFHLDGSILSFCVAGVPFCFPFFLRNLYRNRYGQLQFVEANTYMEQFLYSFQKSGKVLVTLKDVENLWQRAGCIPVSGMRSPILKRPMGKIRWRRRRCRVSSRNIPCSRWQPCTVLPCR